MEKWPRVIKRDQWVQGMGQGEAVNHFGPMIGPMAGLEAALRRRRRRDLYVAVIGGAIALSVFWTRAYGIGFPMVGTGILSLLVLVILVAYLAWRLRDDSGTRELVQRAGPRVRGVGFLPGGFVALALDRGLVLGEVNNPLRWFLTAQMYFDARGDVVQPTVEEAAAWDKGFKGRPVWHISGSTGNGVLQDDLLAMEQGLGANEAHLFFNRSQNPGAPGQRAMAWFLIPRRQYRRDFLLRDLDALAALLRACPGAATVGA